MEINLDESDYRQLYDTLIKEETHNIPWTPPVIYGFINFVIKRLKYGSKSGDGSINWCEQQFKYVRILNIDVEADQLNSVVISSKLGNNIHWICNKIWDKINVDKIVGMISYQQITNYIYSVAMSLVPVNEPLQSIYQYFLTQLAECEAYRIINILNEMGHSPKSNKYVKPIDREVAIFNNSKNSKGFVDTIYLLTNDELAINDWKTGSPKYYFRHKDEFGLEWEPSKWDKEAVEYEIAQYYNLLIGDAFRVFPDQTYKEYEHTYPEYGRVTYLRDWRQTCDFIKIEPEMLDVVRAVSEKKIECINSGNFKRRITKNCSTFCDYYPICSTSKEWKKKFYRQEELYKNAFKYFKI